MMIHSVLRGSLIATVFGLATVFGSPTTAGAETQLNMGGSTTTSGFYPYYTAIANSISNASEDLNVTVVSSGGFAKNQALMMQGQLDFGGISPDLIADAQASGFDGFRVLWWTLPAIQNITATKDSGIDNIAGFAGKCFHPGMNGSSGQKNMMKILRALDVAPDLYMSDPKDAANAIKNGRCLGQMKATTGPRLDSATAELNLTTPLWPVGYTDKQITAIKAALPWMGFYTMPAGVIDGAPEYTVHAIWIGFAATAEMDEATAYEITKGMYEGLDQQRAALKAIAEVDLARQTLEVSEYPLHAGAVRFYREIGLEVPERLIPPEMN